MARWIVCGGVLALAFAAPAEAAGIDCTKARSPTEKAICASPQLRSLDQAIAGAYDDALARSPDRHDAMRGELLAWLKHRDTACALPGPAIPACLTREMTARLAALAPPATVAQTTPSTLPSPLPSPAPTAPPPAGPLQTTAALPRPPDPMVPALPLPAGAATLQQVSLPAAEHAETLLHVTSPGRFTVTAHSSSGAALQLVDQMTGPGEAAGVAGSKDGRLDPLLDVGDYKLRVTSATRASGAVSLSVTAAHDAAPPAALPPPGFPLTSTLRDGEQRAFWLVVPPEGGVRIEAAGRSLADLRLWRDGRELAALDPLTMQATPATGHPLTDVRLEGKVEPGTYLAVAYGGPPLPWTDNDASQPFLLRAGASPALAEGWAGGPMGPFGSEVYAVPPGAALLRLSLPTAAPAQLRAGGALAGTDRDSREPTVSLPVMAKDTPVVEVRAAAGQAFTLQALEQPTGSTVRGPGTFWVSAVANGAGGDEIPPGVLLERQAPGNLPPRIVASTVPQVGPGVGWRARFNLRGPTSLLVQNTRGGSLTIDTKGVDIARPDQLGAYDLPADIVRVNLRPAPGAEGALELSVGPADASAPAPAVQPLPRDPVVPLGVQHLDAGESLRLLGPSAPGVRFGLSARRVPVALAEGPLTVTQAAGTVLSIPVALAPGGTLAVSEVGGGPIPFGLQNAGAPGGASARTVVLPLPDHPRSVVLAWRRPPAPAPTPAPAAPDRRASITAGTPAWFNLGDGETRGYSLTVPEGGLYRVETLGRLHTAGRLATAFIPHLNEAEANGAGENLLLQQILRAGRYRVDVTAKDSAGHLGLLASPGAVVAGGTLVPGGTVRATLPAGSAAAFPLLASGPGERYRLEVATLGNPWVGRIEDAQGWPVAANGPLDGTAPTLPAGEYRLVIGPDAVTRQVVVRLSAVVEAPAITGHGPHPLPFGAVQAATWREPDGRNDPRAPDRWTFALAGPAALTFKLSDGMVGDLYRDGDGAAAAHFVGSYAGTAGAGSYHLDLTSLGRNDRLAYTVALNSEELQPGTPRTVQLPAKLAFAIAAPRVASLTTFGNTPVKGVLRRADGGVVGRYGARADDWNLAASRLLEAGRYTLELAAATPPDLTDTPKAGPAEAADSADGDQPAGDAAGTPDDSDTAPDAAPNADGTPSADGAPSTDGAQQPGATSNSDAGADAAPTSPDTPAPDDSGNAGNTDEAAGPSVAVTLALPETLPALPAPATATEVTGAGVHQFGLPAAGAGSLLVAQARSEASVVLSLERQEGPGWRVVALGEGQGPVAAAVSDGGTWRVQAWAIDGGAEPIRVAVRTVDAAAGPPLLVALDGMAAPLAVAHVSLPTAAPISVQGPAGMLAGSWPGQALAAADGPVLPMDTALWLVGAGAGPVAVQALPLGGGQPLLIPPGQEVRLPVPAPTAGHVALWRAEGGFGQPAMGAAAGIAGTSVVARADAPVVLRRGSGDGPLRVVLTRLDLPLQPARVPDGPLQATLPPGSALPVTLAAGNKVMAVDAGAGVAVFAGGSAAWAGDAPLSRTMTGAWTDTLLVNTGTEPAPVSLAWQPAPGVALGRGSLVKRFYGAAGSFELPFDAETGGRLGVAGAVATAVDGNGAIGRGTDLPVAGAGRVVVEHGVGPVAVWLAADGASPWPAPVAQPVQAPGRVVLAGEAMALTLNLPAASLVHVSTTAPVFSAWGAGVPRLYPAGAELHAVLPAGTAELRLFSPSDGPLTGSLGLAAEPLAPMGEGLGAPVVVAPGGAAAFGFTLSRAGTIGVGVRAAPDTVSVRLLDAAGAVKGEGVAQLQVLPAGRYAIEARVPADAAPATVRAALVGVTPRGSGPPADVVRHYLELAGLKPQEPTK